MRARCQSVACAEKVGRKHVARTPGDRCRNFAANCLAPRADLCLLPLLLPASSAVKIKSGRLHLWPDP